jgi:hypothetical protein
MSRHLALAVAASCLLTLLAPCVWASEAEEKAQKAFDALYGADVKQALSARDATKAVALAAKLIESAKAAEDQPELLALLCTKACELGAMDPQGYDTVQEATDLLVGKAPDAAVPCQEALVAIRQRQYDAARGDAKTLAGETLVDVLVALAATHTRTGKVEEAGKPLYKAMAVAKAIKSLKVETVDALLKAHADRQKNVAILAQLKKQLEADPANAKVRDQLVTLLLVDFDSPAEAAKYLTDTCDATLRKFVPAAAKPVADAPEMACLDLADWYMQLAATAGPAGKAAMYARVAQYGERFLELHTAKDLDRTRAELAVKKAQEEIEKLEGDPFAKGKWIDLLRWIDPEKDTVKGKWQRTAAGLVVAPGRESRITVPIAPAGAYELELKVIRGPGKECGHTILPVGNAIVLFVLNGWDGARSGLSNIGGKDAAQNGTAVPPASIRIGQPFGVKVKVVPEGDQASVNVALDGKPYVAWKGPQSALTIHPDYVMPNKKCLGFGAYQSQLTIQSARLKMLSGKAVPTRPLGR